VIPNTNEVRSRRVVHARARLGDVAQLYGGRSVVVSSSAGVAWATGGLSTPIDRVAASDPVWVVYRDGEITLVTSSVECERLASEYPLDELGLSMVAAPWYENDAHERAVARLVGDDVVSDVAGMGLDASFELVRARLAMCGAELDVLHALAGVATDAVEGVVGRWRPGEQSDRDIASGVVQQLEGHGADAVCLIVGGDDRLRRFRHPMMCGDVPRDAVMVVVVARSLGLHVALTRLADVDDQRTRELMEKCEIVNEYVRDATSVGATWGSVYTALGAGYRAVGQPDAWREHFQGGPIGYAQREFELSPESSESPWWDEPLAPGCAVAFNPSLSGGAKIEDTYVLGEDSLTCATSTSRWPRLKGPASGAAVFRAREKKDT